MDAVGFQFFEAFVGLVTQLRWLLIAVFAAFIGWQLRRCRPEERLQSLLMFLYFFLVITVFWVLKPLKKGMFLQFYSAAGGLDILGWHLGAAQAEMLAKVLNMAVAFLAMVAFTVLARTLRRQQLTYACGAFFAACFLGYSLLLSSPGGATVWTFYLYGDLWSTVMVVTFFAFLNDSVATDAAKRMYGLIVLGGLTGGVFGSSMVAARVKAGGGPSWMWLCLGLTGAIALVAGLAGRRVTDPAAEQAPPAAAPAGHKGNAALEGARLALRSPYLLSVVAIVGLYEMVSTIMDFQFSATVTELLAPELIRPQISNVLSFTNWISFSLQVLLTSFVMTRFGVGIALLFLPLAALCGSATFLVAPVLLVGSLLNTADNGVSYSINQSAKEALYVPTTRDEKYKAKAFIDMFVQRFAKALAVGLSLAITTAFSGFGSVRWLSLVTIAILVLWLAAVRYVGRAFAVREAGGQS